MLGFLDRGTRDLEESQFAPLSWAGFSFPDTLSHISNRQPNPLLLCSELQDLDTYLSSLENQVQLLKTTLAGETPSKLLEEDDSEVGHRDEKLGRLVVAPNGEGLLEKYQAKLAYSGVWMEHKKLDFIGKRVTAIEDEEMDAHLQKLWIEYGLGTSATEVETALLGKHVNRGGHPKAATEHQPFSTRDTGLPRQGNSWEAEYNEAAKLNAKKKDDMRKYDPRIRGSMRLAEQFTKLQKDCIRLSVFAVGLEEYNAILDRLDTTLEAGTLPEFLPTEETISYQVNELIKHKKNQERVIKIMEALNQSEFKDSDLQEQKERVTVLVSKLHGVIKQVNQATASTNQLYPSSLKRVKEGHSKPSEKTGKQEHKGIKLKGSATKAAGTSADPIPIDEMLDSPTCPQQEEPRVEPGLAEVTEGAAGLETQVQLTAEQEEELQEIEEALALNMAAQVTQEAEPEPVAVGEAPVQE